MAGRIYGLPGEPGARDGGGCQVFAATGGKIPLVARVELDADADEGMATVTSFVRDAANNVLVDYQKNEACRATFRTWVRVVPKGASPPEPLKHPIAIRSGDGAIVVVEDPVPSVPAEVTRA